MIKLKRMLAISLVLILLISSSYCETYLTKVNKELKVQGYPEPIITPTKNYYLIDENGLNYFLVYAKTLDSIEVDKQDYSGYWFVGGLLLGIILTK